VYRRRELLHLNFRRGVPRSEILNTPKDAATNFCLAPKRTTYVLPRYEDETLVIRDVAHYLSSFLSDL